MAIVLQDPEKDMLNSDAWLKFTWTDSRLTWDPSEYGGLKNMRVSPDQLWLPDTLLFNGLVYTNLLLPINSYKLLT